MTHRMALSVFPLGLALLGTAASARDAQTRYQSRLFLSGFLLRSAMACNAPTAKSAIDIALGLVTDGDTRAFVKAFPATAERWQREGAANFNTGVLQDGIQPACAHAEKVRRKASTL